MTILKGVPARAGGVTLLLAGGAFGHYLAADFIAATHGNTSDVPAPANAAIAVTASTASISISAGYDPVTDTELRAAPPGRSAPVHFHA
jgi:hypothetical protein